MDRLYQAWLALTGRLHTKTIKALEWELDLTKNNYRVASLRATEAVRLYNESEVARKQSSDALGEAVINRLKGQA